MKKRMRKISLLIVAVLALAGCEKVIELEPTIGDNLVLNAVPMPEKQAFVYFAHTHFFLDTSNCHPIDSVSMTLTVNGTDYLPDSVVRCRYYFPYVYAGGDSVEVHATAGNRQIEAHTYVPHMPQLSNIQFSYNAYGNTLRYYNAQFDLQDRPGERQYYILQVMQRDSGMRFNEWFQQYDTVDTTHATYFMLRHNPEVTGDASYVIPMMGYFYTRNMFNDDEIDGQNYQFQIEIPHLIDTNEVEPFKHEYTVKIESVTFARLRYVIDVARQGNGFFAEQGQVRGNVSGALGIFAGSARVEAPFWPDTIPTLPPNSVTSSYRPEERTIPHCLSLLKKKY